MPDGRTKRMVSLLAYVARNKGTITYSEFADIIGGIARGVGKLLTNELAPHCRSEGLPNLWALVVNAKTGMSTDPDVTQADLDACYTFDWNVTQDQRAN
ncbi:hypothetical protein [Mesorhizobium sp. IMUNJ 23232]|uniref:hypothetical protein n=1 Tax=Mesorhizobium sp. IMUNJ 23232 TaxID=3376064 RepID=UPI0037BB4F23